MRMASPGFNVIGFDQADRTVGMFWGYDTFKRLRITSGPAKWERVTELSQPAARRRLPPQRDSLNRGPKSHRLTVELDAPTTTYCDKFRRRIVDPEVLK